MDHIATLLRAQQRSRTVNANGSDARACGTRMGEAYVADWKTALLFEGYVWNVTIGTLTGGGNISQITGGGAGTTIDQDRPEIIISVASGYTLIPLRCFISCQPDLDADGEEANIVIAADLAAAVALGSSTVTTETPVNLWNNADAGVCPASVYSAANTADITDPTVSSILAFKTVQISDNGTAASAVDGRIELLYEPHLPFLMKGPAAFYGYWGGTAALPGIAAVDFAVVPSDRFSAA